MCRIHSNWKSTVQVSPWLMFGWSFRTQAWTIAANESSVGPCLKWCPTDGETTQMLHYLISLALIICVDNVYPNLVCLLQNKKATVVVTKISTFWALGAECEASYFSIRTWKIWSLKHCNILLYIIWLLLTVDLRFCVN